MCTPSDLCSSTDDVGEAIRTQLRVVDDVLDLIVCDVQYTEAILNESLLDVRLQVCRLSILLAVPTQRMREVFGGVSGVGQGARMPKVFWVSGVKLCSENQVSRYRGDRGCNACSGRGNLRLAVDSPPVAWSLFLTTTP